MPYEKSRFGDKEEINRLSLFNPDFIHRTRIIYSDFVGEFSFSALFKLRNVVGGEDFSSGRGQPTLVCHTTQSMVCIPVV